MSRHYKKLLQKYIKHITGNYNLYIAGFAIVLLIPLLTFTQFPEETQLHSAAGTKTGVTVNLPIENGSYSIFDEENKLVTHDSGLSKTFDLPKGLYRIEFAEQFGFKTPEKQVFTVEKDGGAIIDGNYYPIFGAPLLAIQLFPDNATYKIYDQQNNLVKEGQGSQFFRLPAGNYSIKFDDMEGYSSPGVSQFYLAGQIVTTIGAAYGELQ